NHRDALPTGAGRDRVHRRTPVPPLPGARPGPGFTFRVDHRTAQSHWSATGFSRDHPAAVRAVTTNEDSAVFAEPAVRVTRDGPVSVVALARETKSNAMDSEVTVALLNTLRALSASGDGRAMVLPRDGRSCRPGADIH